jgi:hypothetical protein
VAGFGDALHRTLLLIAELLLNLYRTSLAFSPKNFTLVALKLVAVLSNVI